MVDRRAVERVDGAIISSCLGCLHFDDIRLLRCSVRQCNPGGRL